MPTLNIASCQYLRSIIAFRVLSGLVMILLATSFSNALQPPRGGGERPDGPPPHMRGGTPPKEAIDACIGKAEQSTCVMTTPHGEKSGVCGIPQGTEELACMPTGHKPRKGKPNKANDGKSEASLKSLNAKLMTAIPIEFQ